MSYELYLTLPSTFDLMEAANNDVTKIKNMSEQEIKAAYLANVLAMAVLLKLEDKIAAKLLHDPSHKTLKKLDAKMSILNFWGVLVHNSKHKTTEELYKSADVSKSLNKTAKRMFKETLKTLHYAPSNKTKINWPEMLDAIRVLTLRLPLRNVRVNKIREGLEKFDSSSANDKAQMISQAFHFLMENDKNSELLIRLRAVSNTTLQDANDVEDLKEDEGGGEGGAVSTGDVGGATSAGDIASVPTKIIGGKVITRMPRGFSRLKPYETKKRKRKSKKKKKAK